MVNKTNAFAGFNVKATRKTLRCFVVLRRSLCRAWLCGHGNLLHSLPSKNPKANKRKENQMDAEVQCEMPVTVSDGSESHLGIISIVYLWVCNTVKRTKFICYAGNVQANLLNSICSWVGETHRFGQWQKQRTPMSKCCCWCYACYSSVYLTWNFKTKNPLWSDFRLHFIYLFVGCIWFASWVK